MWKWISSHRSQLTSLNLSHFLPSTLPYFFRIPQSNTFFQACYISYRSLVSPSSLSASGVDNSSLHPPPELGRLQTQPCAHRVPPSSCQSQWPCMLLTCNSFFSLTHLVSLKNLPFHVSLRSNRAFQQPPAKRHCWANTLWTTVSLSWPQFSMFYFLLYLPDYWLRTPETPEATCFASGS